MLSKNDKKFIKEAIREALTIDVRMERHRDMETGQPLAVPVIEEKRVFIPEFWVTYLPFYEAAVRGVQETMDTVKNGQIKNHEAVQAMAEIMMRYERAIRLMPEVLGRIQGMIEHNKPVLEIDGTIQS